MQCGMVLQGLRDIADRVHNFASRLQLASASRNGNVFDTVTVDVADASAIHRKAAELESTLPL